MESIFSQVYYWPYKNKVYSSVHCLAIGFFTFALCYWVQPFELEEYFKPNHFLPVSIVSSISNMVIVGFINIFGLPLLFPKHYRQWTVGKEVFWTTLVILLACCITPAIMELFFGKDESFNFQHFKNMSSWGFLGTLVPLVFSILINQMRYQLIRSNEIKLTLSKTNSFSQIIPESKIKSLTIPTEKGDYHLNIEDVIVIKSSANYSDIYLSGEGNKIKVDRVRCTLTLIEKNIIEQNHLFRCHRTYIVNVNKIDSYAGTISKGFSIVNSLLEFEIPVSRTKSKEFHKNHSISTNS